MYADVLVELKAKQVDKTFTYFVPREWESKIKLGIRVLVPFGRQKLEGFVLQIHKERPEYETKEILELVDSEPILNEEMLELGKYIAKKTMSTLISAYQTMLPAALKARHNFQVPKKYTSYLVIRKEAIVKTEKQRQIYEYVKEQGKALKKEAMNLSTSATKTLLEKGILEEIKEETYRIDEVSIIKTNRVTLTHEQQYVVEEVLKQRHQFIPYLLHGVTGSGKTEVYMHMIEEVLKDGKEVIVLVPEISLTPQMVSQFKKRFGSEVAILHSRLSDGEKYDEWRKIERREVKIAIGARSAIFAPFTNLGLIIIDEEHSSTYKQENNPRYHAIDIALYRAKRYHIPLILGSATPSIESYTRARMGIYHLLELKNRISKHMPKVLLVDMKEEYRYRNRVFSRILKEKILDRLERQEQMILLLNRRGYSTVITCKACGYTDKCPNCDIPLTYHKTSHTMRCHYCGYGAKKPTICPNCKSENINEFGMGTEKLEEYIREMFPSARIVRMDMDTTSRKGSHEKIIEEFGAGHYDILLGTQMIAKGLDFPNVTLVGVLNGDATLNIPDFRSGERTFQLLNQVAGRAGRSDKSGEVVIQCFNTNHYSIRTSATHDYLGFYKEEMKIRKTLHYPPYCNLALLKIVGKELEKVESEAKKIGTYLRCSKKSNLLILGPSPANMLKVNNRYYYQIIVKYKKREDIWDLFSFLKEQYQSNSQVSLDFDFNPLYL